MTMSRIAKELESGLGKGVNSCLVDSSPLPFSSDEADGCSGRRWYSHWGWVCDHFRASHSNRSPWAKYAPKITSDSP